MNLSEFDPLTLINNNKTVIIILSALFLFLTVLLLRKLIRSFFKRTAFIEERKENTLESMFNSIIGYSALIAFILIVIGQFTEIGSLLAGAGIIGIIIGFGAQSLIKDFFAGLFFLYEKQLHKGDFITLNNSFHGTVEDIGLRFLKIREWSGRLLTISNGQITTIENYNFEYMRVIENVTANFREDPRHVLETLDKACERLNVELDQYLKKNEHQKPIEPFQVYGVNSLNDQYRGYQYTITGVVHHMIYWTAAKETRRIIAETMFDFNIAMAEQRVELNTSSSSEE